MKVIEVPASFDLRDLRPVERAATLSRAWPPHNTRFTHRPKEPIRPTYASDSTWRGWLVDDQRFAADRTDVLTYTSDVLTAPLRTRVNP